MSCAPWWLNALALFGIWAVVALVVGGLCVLIKRGLDR